MWVHMGGMGPRSPKLMPNGGMPPPPYQMKDNQDTWLDQTDLVFIDPVGTGYSRAKTIEVARRMNGVQGDIQSVGEFMRMYIARNNRELSPLFIAGESYGTFRAAGLAGYLIERGIAFNGVVLIGTTLNLETIWSRSDDLVYQLELPTYAADAWYHKKVAADLQKKDLQAFLKEVEAFAHGRICRRAGQGRRTSRRGAQSRSSTSWCAIPASTRIISTKPICAGTSPTSRASCCATSTRPSAATMAACTGPSALNTGETSEFDPSSTLITPPFTAMFTNYIRDELGYKTDMFYYPSGGIQPWDYGVQNGFGDTTACCATPW